MASGSICCTVGTALVPRRATRVKSGRLNCSSLDSPGAVFRLATMATPLNEYGSVKSTLSARAGVMVMPPMIMSKLPASRAGMMPSHAVGTGSCFTPRSAASRRATSSS